MPADIVPLFRMLLSPISFSLRSSQWVRKLGLQFCSQNFSSLAVNKECRNVLNNSSITNLLTQPNVRAKHKKLIPGVTKWPEKNKMIYPPQEPHEEKRPAWVCHHRDNIKYPPKKMWYVANLIRGMSIDEAIKQLSFVPRKGAHIVKEVLEEAQELAVKEHNVEYKSNLWVGESLVVKGRHVKGLRKHARMRFGTIEYKYCHYLVRLVEGPPPKHYYPPEPSGNEKLQEYIQELRNRTIQQTI